MFDSYKDIMTPGEAFEALGIHRSKGYSLLADGTIPSFHLGRRICVPKAHLIAFVEEQTRLDSIRRTSEREVS